MNKFLLDKNLNVENTIMEQLGMSLLLLFVSPSLTCEYLCFSGLDFNIISLFKVDIVFATLDCMIKAARELFDMMDEEDMKEGYSSQARTFKGVSTEASCSLELNNGSTKVRELAKNSYSPSLLQQTLVVHGAQDSSPLNQKNGKVEELKPNAKEVKSNSEVIVAELKPGNPTTPSRPMMPSKGPAPSPPTSVPPQKRPAPPPPPPLGATKSLHRKAATTKLKRSVQMINLFRNLKRNVEGSSLFVSSADVNHERRAPTGTRTEIGGAAGWKQGLAASLAELTKRFASHDTFYC
jgi:hypothetical protein